MRVLHVFFKFWHGGNNFCEGNKNNKIHRSKNEANKKNSRFSLSLILAHHHITQTFNFFICFFFYFVHELGKKTILYNNTRWRSVCAMHSLESTVTNKTKHIILDTKLFY